MRKIVDTILPTTMVGSYPRPSWFTYQLLGRDARVAFKHAPHEEAYADATRVIIQDQEEAGLDIVCDGQMYYDDYIGLIGSFCWYMYERIPGFDPAKEEHPAAVDAATMTKELMLLSDWGGVVNSGPIEGTAPLRLVDFYKLARRYATRPLKVSVGAGPVNLAWHVYFQHYKDPRELSYALAPIFNQEMKALTAAGADFLQYEDLGAWLPLFTKNDDDFKWIGDVVRRCVQGVDAKIAWHFCYGNAWGNRLAGLFPAGYEAVLPHFYELPIDQFVLDFANRDMVDIAALQVAAQGQGGGDRRDRRAHQHGRDARGGRGAHPQGDRCRAARAGLSDHRLRDEAALAHGGSDEAQGAGRGCQDRAQGTRARLRAAPRGATRRDRICGRVDEALHSLQKPGGG